MARPHRTLITAVRDTLAELADPEKAPQMQAYMKSKMPFVGVAAPERRKAFRAVFAAHPIDEAARWRATARTLWDSATHREHRYAAIALTGFRAYRAFRDLDALPLFEHFIVDGAWWDYVDEVAIHRVGPLFEIAPVEVRARMRRWSVDDDRWRRRTSIVCQIAKKGDADLDLLLACIEPSLDARDFFLRKAIGWALRQVAWSRPQVVIEYVRAHKDRLSGLSKREALKNVLENGLIDAIP